jgi:hypothetical protein
MSKQALPTHNQTLFTMVTGIKAAGALKHGFQLTTLKAYINKDKNLGAVYYRIQEMMEQWKILHPSPSNLPGRKKWTLFENTTYGSTLRFIQRTCV